MSAPRVRPVPVTLLAGFLGSGKTTLLNRILAGDHGRRMAVLVNDFGDVSIDRELVASADETSVTLTNGCICCSIRDDLIGTVRDLLRRPEPPEQIVVEMSGIADPGAVLRSFQLMEKRWPLEVDGIIAVVDVEHFPEPDEEHHVLAREQLVLADVVLVNKVDLVSPERVAALTARIIDWVPSARIVETVHAEAPLELVLGLAGRRARDLFDPSRKTEPGPVEHHGFSTMTYRSRELFSLERLREATLELPPGVFRAKGFVQLDARPDTRVLLQVVGRRARVSLDEPWGDRPRETVIVLIGASGSLDSAEIGARFDACRVRAGGGRLEPLRAAVDWIRARWRAQ